MAGKPKEEPREIRPRPPNPDDEFCDQLRESCARAMAQHLKGSINTQRPINTLKLPEMMALAEACTAHWIVEVSKRLENPVAREYKDLIFGG